MTGFGRPRRILIVRLSHLGDVVHALPVYHALREGEPEAELGWVVQDEFAPLVEGLSGVRRVFRFARRGGLGAWLALERELDAWPADVVVDAQGNVKSAMVGLVCRAPRRVGLARANWRERFAAHVLTEAAPPAAGRHALDRMLGLARHLVPDAKERFDPELGADEIARGEALADRHLGAADLVLAVPRPHDPRSLEPRQVLELARALAPVLVLSGPAEAESGRWLEAELRGVLGVGHWVGQRGLRELAAFFTAAASRSARLVACDSGPMHLASACGMAVELVAGPQDARRTGPWPVVGAGSPHRVHVHGSPPDCAPCLRPRCVHARGAVCMTTLDAHEVARAVRTADPPRQGRLELAPTLRPFRSSAQRS